MPKTSEQAFAYTQSFTKAEMEAIRRAARDEEGVLADFVAMVRRFARYLPFMEDALAAYHCVRDPHTSPHVRIILLGALAYFVMPVDAMPDFLPLLGFTDDAAVLTAALQAVRGAITVEHQKAARESLRN